MPRLSKLIEKIEDRLANKWGCWYERNKARVPLYAVLGLSLIHISEPTRPY